MHNRTAMALCLTALLFLPFSIDSTSAATEDRPNFIVVLVDDLGWTDLGCFGSTYYETPNIDRLSKQGMKFTDGYAACAVCSPTRAAVMTGRYPARTGVTDWIRARFQGGGSTLADRPPAYQEAGSNKRIICPRNPYWLERDEVTIAEQLKTAGYVSAHIGKWHLGPDDWYPDKQGFDYNYGGCDYGQPPSYFDPYRNKKLQQGIPHLPPRKEGEYLTDREADEACGFIRKHKDRPFFLYMAHYAVHTPIQGRKDLVQKYEAKPKTHQKNAAYAAMVESVDHAVGRIMQTLKEEKLEDRTLVIFTSDNGGLSGPTNNKPLRAGKGYPYEGGIRVPFIARWPGTVPAGSTCDTPVISVDIMPTLCEFAGIDPPGGRVLDGESLAPLLKQKGSLERSAVYWHFPHYRGKGVPPYSIIRDGGWKLIKRYDGKPFELFNLARDLGEQQELSGEMPDKVKALDAKLMAHLKSAGAKLPKPNPAYSGPKK